MSTVGSFSRHNHLDELDEPLSTNEGFLSPATRRSRVRTNMGLTGEVGAINQIGGSGAAVTATADGLTTGLIAAGVAVVRVTSGNAAHIVSLPGIAANSLPVGYTVRARNVSANAFEVRAAASSTETINGVAEPNEAVVAATSGAFTAVVESATGWMLIAGTATVPDA